MYDQLCLEVINEMFLMGNIRLTFGDYRLFMIKQIHNEFISGLDIIMIIYIYQVPLVWDSLIFKTKVDGLNFSWQNFTKKWNVIG
jgi:hypothetical protein